MTFFGAAPDGVAAQHARWVVVVPVKPWATAKTRLASDPAVRAALARAFVLDVVAAARRTPGVGAVLVVTGEPALRTAFAPASPGDGGQVLVEDDRGRGLDDSVRLGVELAGRRWPGASVAVVTADLPALRSPDLAAVLEAAAPHPRAVVADAEGSGTTVLTTTAGAAVRPAFGLDSFARHRGLGAVDVTAAAADGVRRDVDVDAHLRAARRLGVGEHTAASDALGAPNHRWSQTADPPGPPRTP